MLQPRPDNLSVKRAAAASGQATAVLRLMLSHYRNYPRLSLELTEAPVVLFGDNGVGKTNILEAVSWLAPGRGLRGAALSDIRPRPHPEQPWAVSARLRLGDSLLQIGTGVDVRDDDTDGLESAGDRRIARLDGQTVSVASLGERLRLGWLTPQMDRLFLDGGTARRQFLDRLALALEPTHGSTVNAYDKAMRERNKLLRDSAATGQPAETAWLDAVEGRMAEYGVALAAGRLDVVARLRGALQEDLGPFPSADLAIDGQVEAALVGQTAAAAESRLRDQLAANRRRDQDAGRALEGPHRSDLKVWHRRHDMEAENCSTGEQKALLIAIAIAHARLVAARSGLRPILLLDEVAAHLDSERRQALMQLLLDLQIQAWLSGTDRRLFEALEGRAQFFEVARGAADDVSKVMPKATMV